MIWGSGMSRDLRYGRTDMLPGVDWDSDEGKTEEQIAWRNKMDGIYHRHGSCTGCELEGLKAFAVWMIVAIPFIYAVCSWMFVK